MTLRWCGLFSVLSLLLAFSLSCAGDSSNPAVPIAPGAPELSRQTISEQTLDGHQPGHYLWGFYFIYVNPEKNQFEIVPVRGAATHWNVLKWLEQGPCTNCLKITNIEPSGTGTLLIDVEITHPFSNPNLTGFDVRGIPMFAGSHAFPVSGLNMPDRTLGDGELVNADGYTTLYNISTLGSGPGGMQGYFKGKLATQTPPNALLNGFKRFVSDDPANTRNAFYAGDTVRVTYEIDMPDGPFVFGYAVDASWAPPLSKPVDDPMTDFGPEANCLEPWKIEVTGGDLGSAAQVDLMIDVYDWSGKDSHAVPVLECPELFAGTVSASWSEDGIGYSRYVATVHNELDPGQGWYECLLSVEDNENDPVNEPWLDLTAYQVHEIDADVLVQFPPVAIASADPIVTSTDEPVHFQDEASYDPDGGSIVKYEWDWDNDGMYDEEGPNVFHSWGTGGTYQVQFRVTDDEGAFDELDQPLQVEISDLPTETGWALTWGGSDDDNGYAVAVAGLGNAYITGRFTGTCDFDPGSGADSHTSNGGFDVFLSKYDSSGNSLWTRTWGGTDNDSGSGVAADVLGNVYITGDFWGECDFDPGSGTDNHSSNGFVNPFLSKFDPDGYFLWARTWGGTEGVGGYGICVDSPGSVYVTGNFKGTCDFYPDTGVDDHSSNGYSDAFLSKFDSDGNFLWARTCGGSDWDWGFAVTSDNFESTYVVGDFGNTCDFDPGSGIDNHTSSGGPDVFLCKFGSSGNLLWARVWGASSGDGDYGLGVAADGAGNAYTTGYFHGTCDFDPGVGVHNRTCGGYVNAFLSRLDSNGDFHWAQTWGDGASAEGLGVATDDTGNAFVTGYFLEYLSPDGVPDALLSKFSSDGDVLWTRLWGGSGNTIGHGVAVDDSGSAYVAGYFEGSNDFDPGPGADNHTSNGLWDAFLSRLLPDGSW